MKLAQRVLESYRSVSEDNFKDYFMLFYGPKGNFKDTFKPPLTDKEFDKHFAEFKKIRKTDFHGDSFDREFYRDFLLHKRGVKDTEWDMDFFIKNNKGKMKGL